MKNKYKITKSNFNYYINGVRINDDIFSDEKVDYRIENREDFIDTLIDWLSEAEGSNRELMKQDLKMLMKVKDTYILSSISTNEYLYSNSEQFDLECENILLTNSFLAKFSNIKKQR
ncbi:MAG: hypothetical protein ACRCX2_09705 [Paraclostridium sp.]